MTETVGPANPKCLLFGPLQKLLTPALWVMHSFILAGFNKFSLHFSSLISMCPLRCLFVLALSCLGFAHCLKSVGICPSPNLVSNNLCVTLKHRILFNGRPRLGKRKQAFECFSFVITGYWYQLLFFLRV